MAQCQGTTRKGDRCKRDARGGSGFCSIHVDQEVRARSTPESIEWDRDATIKAVIGCALIGAIIFFKFKR